MVIAIFTRQHIVCGASHQRIRTAPATQEHGLRTTSINKIVARAPHKDFGLGPGHVEQYPPIPHHLNDVNASAGIDVGRKVIGIDQQYVIAITSIERVTAEPSRQPV